MTGRNAAVAAARGETAAGAALTVAMVTRRAPSQIGGVERVAAGPLPDLARTRPAWRLGTAAGPVAVHQQVAAGLRSVYGCRGPVTVIPNGLDAAMAGPWPARRTGRAGLTALWVGQVGYRKGLDVALAAVAQARRDLPGLRL